MSSGLDRDVKRLIDLCDRLGPDRDRDIEVHVWTHDQTREVAEIVRGLGHDTFRFAFTKSYEGRPEHSVEISVGDGLSRIPLIRRLAEEGPPGLLIDVYPPGCGSFDFNMAVGVLVYSDGVRADPLDKPTIKIPDFVV